MFIEGPYLIRIDYTASTYSNKENMTEEKRKVPPMVAKILATDVYMTDQFVKKMEKILAFHQLQTHYKMLEISCHGLVWIPCWIAFIWVFSSKSLYQMQVNFLIGLLLDTIVICLLKALTRRRRPTKASAMDLGPDKFSFPSGHASRAFYVACFFLYNWPVHFIFVSPLLCWATSVCLSRILMRRHHLLDVFVGCIVGVIEALFIGLIYLDYETSANLIWWLTDEKLDGGDYHV